MLDYFQEAPPRHKTEKIKVGRTSFFFFSFSSSSQIKDPSSWRDESYRWTRKVTWESVPSTVRLPLLGRRRGVGGWEDTLLALKFGDEGTIVLSERSTTSW